MTTSFRKVSSDSFKRLFQGFLIRKKALRTSMLDVLKHQALPFVRQKNATVESVTTKLFMRVGLNARENFR